MGVKQEINEYFASSLEEKRSAYTLSGFEDEYKTWVIRRGNVYGVAIKYDGPEIYETFANATLSNETLYIEKIGTVNVLSLLCTNERLRHSFATVCEDFIRLGENGKNRNAIKQNPIKWWSQWVLLLGNAQNEKRVYDVIGELLVLLKLYSEGYKAVWSAMHDGTHDIEMDNCSFEVKTTLSKSKASITVSSQFQLSSQKPLHLIFTRLEESMTGKSINDIILEMSNMDINTNEIEDYLTSIGMKKGSHYRNKRYIILERRDYIINNYFPKITAESFTQGIFPLHITHIEYTIDLDGIKYDIWN